MKFNSIYELLGVLRSTHGLHRVLIVILPLSVEDGWQRLPRIHVPRAQDVGLASGRHSENSKSV